MVVRCHLCKLYYKFVTKLIINQISISAINCINSRGADFLFKVGLKMKKITIIGGDNRLMTVKKMLEDKGYLVDSLGLFQDDIANLNTSKVVVLPVPTTKDGENIYTPLTNKKIPLSFVYENTDRKQLILCCNYLFEKRNCIDYNSLDSYALLNAVPTAEGAIKIAIENTPFTLWGARVLVIGYGRVGKILSNRLKALGCDLTVSARKDADFALLQALGIPYMHTSEIGTKPLDYQIVFNTVDHPVIPDCAFENSSCSLLIDLSSKGGFNLSTAKEFGITAIKAPGLPGIIAPKTAGEILGKVITELILRSD